MRRLPLHTWIGLAILLVEASVLRQRNPRYLPVKVGAQGEACDYVHPALSCRSLRLRQRNPRPLPAKVEAQAEACDYVRPDLRTLDPVWADG